MYDTEKLNVLHLTFDKLIWHMKHKWVNNELWKHKITYDSCDYWEEEEEEEINPILYSNNLFYRLYRKKLKSIMIFKLYIYIYTVVTNDVAPYYALCTYNGLLHFIQLKLYNEKSSKITTG